MRGVKIPGGDFGGYFIRSDRLKIGPQSVENMPYSENRLVCVIGKTSLLVNQLNPGYKDIKFMLSHLLRKLEKIFNFTENSRVEKIRNISSGAIKKQTDCDSGPFSKTSSIKTSFITPDIMDLVTVAINENVALI